MLTSKERSYLSGMAKDAATVMLGKGGPSDALVAQLETHLACHELVRLRFVDFKEEKGEIAARLAEATESELVRVIGNTAIFYRRNPDPEKRVIELPGEKA